MRCLNCGESAGPLFCGHCGQAIDDHRSPLLTLIGEALQEALSLDGRLLQTLAALRRPGVLTRRFLEGKRASFLSPVRLYLFTSVALFSSVLALPTPAADSVNVYVGGELLNGPRQAQRTNITIATDNTAFGALVAGRQGEGLARLKAMPPQDMLDRLFSGLRSVLPLALIVFVPFLALALKVLYLRRRALYVDHLVFSAHFQAALFIVLAAVWALSRVTFLPLSWTLLLYLAAFLLMVLWYLPRSLRRVYDEGASLTAIKTLVLAFVYLQLLMNVVGLSVLLVILRL
jgi:hypothetical protein